MKLNEISRFYEGLENARVMDVGEYNNIYTADGKKIGLLSASEVNGALYDFGVINKAGEYLTYTDLKMLVKIGDIIDVSQEGVLERIKSVCE